MNVSRFFLSFILSVFLFVPLQTHAFSITPAKVIFPHANVHKTYSKFIEMSFAGLEGTAYVQPIISEELKDIIRVNPELIPVNQGDGKEYVEIIVDPSVEKELKNYTGNIIFQSEVFNQSGAKLGLSLTVDVTLVDTEVKKYAVKAVNVRDSAITDEMDISFRFDNNGNTPVEITKVEVEFTDVEETHPDKRIEFLDPISFNPYMSETIQLSTTHQLPLGWQDGIIRIYEGETLVHTKSFQVLVSQQKTEKYMNAWLLFGALLFVTTIFGILLCIKKKS